MLIKREYTYGLWRVMKHAPSLVGPNQSGSPYLPNGIILLKKKM